MNIGWCKVLYASNKFKNIIKDDAFSENNLIGLIMNYIYNYILHITFMKNI